MLATTAVLRRGSARRAPSRARFRSRAAASQNDVYPERVTQFADGVTGLADVTYSVLPGFRPLVLDLYLPSSTTAQPLILFVHGGGWVGGNTRHSGALADFPRALAQLAAEGFVVASVEYRLVGEAAFPAPLQDVRAALRYLRDNAAKYRIDGSKVAVWGGSAGGQLAALAAVSCGDSRSRSQASAGRQRVRARRRDLVRRLRLRTLGRARRRRGPISVSSAAVVRATRPRGARARSRTSLPAIRRFC